MSSFSLLPALLLLSAILSPLGTGSLASEQAKSIQWEKLPGDAIDIDISMHGDVWVVAGDGSIRKWNGADWDVLPGNAVRVTAGRHGEGWIVDKQNRIFRWDGDGWFEMPGRARDVAVGASGRIWMIGTDEAPGGYEIYKWGVTDWVRVPGAGVRIAVGPKGNPWIVDDRGAIYRLTRGVWINVPGVARDITIAANGVAWIVDPTDKTDAGLRVRRWSGKLWELYEGALMGIATDARGYPWGFNASNEIFADRRSKLLAGK